MEANDDELKPFQTLAAATASALVKQQPLRSGAQHNQRRDEYEKEKESDEAARSEIARIEARLRVLNWIYFVLHSYPQRH